jgi:CARDB/Sigma-70 region 2
MATVARAPDAELLLRLRSRDREAWEELYAEYQPRLRAFGYRLAGNVHDADDLVQETFVRAVPRLDRLDHAFSVRATDKAGNVGKPASVAWRYVPPDTTTPTVTLASTSPASTTDTSASFTFAASEPGVTYECSLDAAAYAACASPASYQSLGVGTHTFAVRGRDPAGNRGPPATFGWSIVAPPPPLPDLYVASFTKNTITVRNRGNAAAGTSVLTITLVGTFTVPALAPGASATFSWSTCRAGTYSAIVDRTNVVVESDEKNNTASRANTCP